MTDAPTSPRSKILLGTLLALSMGWVTFVLGATLSALFLVSKSDALVAAAEVVFYAAGSAVAGIIAGVWLARTLPRPTLKKVAVGTGAVALLVLILVLFRVAAVN